MDLPASLTGDPEHEAMIERLEALLFDPIEADEGDPPLKLYALLDASKSADIPVYLEAFNSPATCLFDGQTRDDLAEVAPWLVQFDRYSDAWDWFVEEGWGNGWGILIHSRQPIGRLKTHFKKFLRMPIKDDDPMFFKFYRPEHFAAYIASLGEDFQSRMMAGLDAVFCSNIEVTNELIEFSLTVESTLSTVRYELGKIKLESEDV